MLANCGGGTVGTVGAQPALYRWNYGDRPMAHWRKRNPPASQFNAYLAGLGFAFSIVLGTLMFLTLRGHI